MNGSLGPMARTVADLAKLLDVIVGYDPDDPATAHGVGRAPQSFAALLDPNALKGARIGILREPMGYTSEPASEDFAKITEVFERAIAELGRAGATIVDPIVIPDLNVLLAKRVFGSDERETVGGLRVDGRVAGLGTDWEDGPLKREFERIAIQPSQPIVHV